jgi:hypothetical protein
MIIPPNDRPALTLIRGGQPRISEIDRAEKHLGEAFSLVHAMVIGDVSLEDGAEDLLWRVVAIKAALENARAS